MALLIVRGQGKRRIVELGRLFQRPGVEGLLSRLHDVRDRFLALAGLAPVVGEDRGHHSSILDRRFDVLGHQAMPLAPDRARNGGVGDVVDEDVLEEVFDLASHPGRRHAADQVSRFQDAKVVVDVAGRAHGHEHSAPECSPDDGGVEQQVAGRARQCVEPGSDGRQDRRREMRLRLFAVSE